MRIQKLCFENINSYEGRVEIDFTDPWFSQGNNQFVISGPTGAGKSTILDAITLALYGSTDRLGKVTKNSHPEELINKRSGYCMAKVLYSCSEGIYESTYEIHKAYDKKDGKIQDPVCTLHKILSDGVKESVLSAGSISALEEKNQGLIGLTYDQFIRCILIPQGEFDRFLNSKDREKASILARLSHTEFYKETARILNEKASEVNKAYELLLGQRDAICVMSEEERKEAKEKNQKLEERVKKQQQEVRELTEKINWLEQFQKAEEKYRIAETNLNAIKAKQGLNDSKIKELKDARSAEDCDKEYKALSDCEGEQKGVQAELEKKERELKTQQENLETVTREAGVCEKEYEDQKRDREIKSQLWAKVRKLDTDISVAKNKRMEKERVCQTAGENLKTCTEKYAEYEKNIVSYNASLQERKDYLDGHKEDEALAESLTGYAEKIKAWKTAADEQKKSANLKKKSEEKRELLQKEKEDLLSEKEALSDKLYQLVSGKYLLVAEILRKDLKPGGCCPVCGKAVGSDDVRGQDASENRELTKEQNETAMGISGQKDDLEETERAIREKEGILQSIDNDIERAGQAVESARKTLMSLASELSGFLAPWGVSVDPDTSASDLEKTGENLAGRKEAYKENKKQCDEYGRMLSETKVKMEAIDIDKLREEYGKAETEFQTADKEYSILADQRKEIFGDTSVDEAEKEFDRDLNAKEAANRDAEKRMNDTKTAIKELGAKIDGFRDRDKELARKRSSLQTEFMGKLQTYGFSSTESFLTCRKEKAEIKALEEIIKEFDTEKTKAETQYALAKSELSNFRKENRTSEALAVLKEKAEELNRSKSVDDQQIGSLTAQLAKDDTNRVEWEEADKQLQKKGEEAQIYKEISDMLGKKDGSDFEVFVHGIAMRSLLEKANVYLTSIIPSYRLVQTETNSVDFCVHEKAEDATVLVRDLKNFSGGEKFIISLSLALAMAEFAGEKGGVECIFLDEGFGSLSGEPLVEAINALKKLSSTGKMLGIITHIEAVVNQFHCIAAEKRGERSVLIGGGVKCAKAEKKKAK